MSPVWKGYWAPGFRAASPPGMWRLMASGCAAAPRHYPPARIWSPHSASLEGVIGQLRMEPETNEITAALQLLKTLPLKDAIVTGDAMFTQREICRVIKDGGGDYFFTVKDNQLALKADIALAFGPTSPLGDMDAAA
jgi:hypothetical protein